MPKCKRCGHKWDKRLKGRTPVQCPRCKSPLWNKQRVNKKRRKKRRY